MILGKYKNWREKWFWLEKLDHVIVERNEIMLHLSSVINKRGDSILKPKSFSCQGMPNLFHVTSVLVSLLIQKRKLTRNLTSFRIGPDGSVYRDNEVLLEDDLAIPADINI